MIIEMILHDFYLTYLPPQQPGAGWGCQAPDDWPAAVLRFRGSGSVTGSDAPRPEAHGQRFIKFHQVSTATRAPKNMGYSETLTKLGQDWIRLDTSDIFFQTKKKHQSGSTVQRPWKWRLRHRQGHDGADMPHWANGSVGQHQQPGRQGSLNQAICRWATASKGLTLQWTSKKWKKMGKGQYLRARGKGRKLAWQCDGHETQKVAQRRSLLGSPGEGGQWRVEVRSLYVGGDKDENIWLLSTVPQSKWRHSA